MEINGKSAIVTGAGQGIGKASALMLARSGASKVVLADIDEHNLDQVATAVRDIGVQAIVKVCDVSDSDNVIRLLQSADTETGGLDIVHNNAGIMTGAPDFPDSVMEKMIAVIQVNLLAMMVGTRQAIDLMRARSSAGVIINTASTAAFAPMMADPAYSASKAGIVNFTQSCAPLQEDFNIRVMAVCPGMTDTAIVPHDAEWLQPALASTKLLQPEDIADSVKKIIEDDGVTGDYVVVTNEPLGGQ